MGAEQAPLFLGQALLTVGAKAFHSKTELRRQYKNYRDHYSPRCDVSFFLQDWEDPYNVGGLLRVADGCGVKEVFASGRTPLAPDPQIAVTSMGAHRRLEIKHLGRHEEAAVEIASRGWTLVAVEIAPDAVVYTDYPWQGKICLVLGNEGAGVYGSVMKLCGASVYIPLLGKGRSLNVHVAAAIVAFEALLG